MKVKELIAKYPNHDVVEQGTPRDFPFTNLPAELQGLSGRAYQKVEMELEVKGYKVVNKPFKSIDITAALFGGRQKKPKEYAGYLYIYLKEGK